MSNLRVADGRMPPFCWQDKVALRLIHEKFKKSEIATALAVYTALTMYASNFQAETFQIRRKTLCDFVGRSGNVVDGYLAQLAELGLIEKAPMARDNQYTCMTFTVLQTPEVSKASKSKGKGKGKGKKSVPTKAKTPKGASRGVGESEAPLPTGGVSLPTGTPPSLSTGRGVSVGRDTPICQQGNEIEESIRKKNRSYKPSAPAGQEARGERGTNTEEAHARGAGEEPAGPPAASHLPGMNGTGRVGGAGTKSWKPESETFESKRGGSGMTVPGDEDEKPERRSRARKNTLPPAHPNKDPDTWKTPDVVQYFKYRWLEAWPPEGKSDLPTAYPPILAGIRGRLAWLDAEGIPRGAVRRMVDHLFDNWGDDLRERFRWEDTRPSFLLISKVWHFEQLAREIGVVKKLSPRKGAKGGPTHDSYDADAAKRSRESEDGWG